MIGIIGFLSNFVMLKKKTINKVLQGVVFVCLFVLMQAYVDSCRQLYCIYSKEKQMKSGQIGWRASCKEADGLMHHCSPHLLLSYVQNEPNQLVGMN